jgi:hypothetical protein
VDALLILLAGGCAAVGLWLWLSRSRVPARRGGVAPLGLRSGREIVERRDALEAEDLDQLLEATNARRRARGLPERSREDVHREYGAGAR